MVGGAWPTTLHSSGIPQGSCGNRWFLVTRPSAVWVGHAFPEGGEGNKQHPVTGPLAAVTVACMFSWGGCRGGGEPSKATSQCLVASLQLCAGGRRSGDLAT